LKFFPSDWRADPKLRACSLAARGLWIEMVGLMHESNPRGFLRINGHPPNEIELARQVGAMPREVRAALTELRKNDVCSVTEDGVFFSRRLLREVRRSAANGENGAKGAEARWRDASGNHGETDGELVGEHDGERGGEHRGPRSQKPQSQNPLPPEGVLCSDELRDMASEFLRRYPVIYARCRSGAFYRVREARDFPAAVELVNDYQPLDRLEAMLEVFLKRQDTAHMGKPGSPRQFQHYAPDCDRLLRENGR
jgi:hypothetical protein